MNRAEIVARIPSRSVPAVQGWVAAARALRPEVDIDMRIVGDGPRVEVRLAVSDREVDRMAAGYLGTLGSVGEQGLFGFGE